VWKFGLQHQISTHPSPMGCVVGIGNKLIKAARLYHGIMGRFFTLTLTSALAMALLTASQLSKSYGPDDIFSGVTLSVPYKARIAIVGPNGIGKTTLLRLLMGIEEPSSGQIRRARKISIGYLPQEASLHGEHSLWQECLSAVGELRAMEARLAEMESAMSDPQQAGELLERYGALQQEFELLGGYTYETRIRQTLTGLGFDKIDFHRPLGQLSGGQRTRALLARLLLSKPDLLVLDEPTNHLDIKAVEWLEGYLSKWEGAALLVSHDRYFLDRVVDHIWEMTPSGLETYRGNYSAYLVHRQERWDLSQQIYESERARLEKELDYIKRNIAGQNTTQAKGKLRRLRTGRSHLRRKKSKRVLRSFDKYEKVDPVDRKRVRRLLGLKHRKK